MKSKLILVLIAITALLFSGCNTTITKDSYNNSKCKGYVTVSKKNPRYFELTTGEPYIPCGMNICFQLF